MAMEIKDTATNEALTNERGSVAFKCPSCGKATINRIFKSRVLATKYKCKECGFEGPN